MSLLGRGRRRGLIVGAAVGSSRAKKAAISAQPQPVVVSNDSAIEQLKQFAELKEQGILTQAEFDAKKKQLLGI